MRDAEKESCSSSMKESTVPLEDKKKKKEKRVIGVYITFK